MPGAVRSTSDVALALRSHGRTGGRMARHLNPPGLTLLLDARVHEIASLLKEGLNPLRRAAAGGSSQIDQHWHEPRIDQAARWFFDGDSPHKAHPPRERSSQPRPPRPGDPSTVRVETHERLPITFAQ